MASFPPVRRGIHYLPGLFLARETAAEEAEIAPTTPPEQEETWPPHGVLGCRGGGDPFVGVELSEERPESSRPSSPPMPFSWLAWTRTRVGRPVVRRRAPLELSDDGEAILTSDEILEPAILDWIIVGPAKIARGSSAFQVSLNSLVNRTLSKEF